MTAQGGSGLDLSNPELMMGSVKHAYPTWFAVRDPGGRYGRGESYIGLYENIQAAAAWAAEENREDLAGEGKVALISPHNDTVSFIKAQTLGPKHWSTHTPRMKLKTHCDILCNRNSQRYTRLHPTERTRRKLR